MYKLTDSQFKSALREAVIQHASRPNGPYEGKLPEDFKPMLPLWFCGEDLHVDRRFTLAHGPYSFLTPEQREKLLEEV